jgi:hypothetical protein
MLGTMVPIVPGLACGSDRPTAGAAGAEHGVPDLSSDASFRLLRMHLARREGLPKASAKRAAFPLHGLSSGTSV